MDVCSSAGSPVAPPLPQELQTSAAAAGPAAWLLRMPRLPSCSRCSFTTHTGTVAAADEWDSPVQLKAVRKSLPASYEHLFHK